MSDSVEKRFEADIHIYYKTGNIFWLIKPSSQPLFYDTCTSDRLIFAEGSFLCLAGLYILLELFFAFWIVEDLPDHLTTLSKGRESLSSEV